MDYGFIKVAAATPKIKVADVDCNTELICNQIDEAAKNGAKVLVFPELCLTGYTCSDLFWQSLMLEKVKEKTIEIARYSKDYDMLIMIGIPYEHNGKLYNVGVVLHKGKILGMVTKKHLPNYSEFYEARHFTKGFEKAVTVDFAGQKVPMGTYSFLRPYRSQH